MTRFAGANNFSLVPNSSESGTAEAIRPPGEDNPN